MPNAAKEKIVRADKLLLAVVGLLGAMSTPLGGVDRANAQELLCPQTGIPMSQDPGCTTPNYGNQENSEAPAAPRAIPPGMNPKNLPPPDPNVEGFWGSLVVGPDQRIFWSNGRRDRESAEQTALDRCRSDEAANMDGCLILNSGQTVDVALAFDGTSYFVGRVVGYDKAMKKALKACQAGSHPDQCRISLLYSPVGGAVPEDVAKVVYGF